MKKLSLFLLTLIPAFSQYCSTATPDCTAKLPLGDGSKFALYYRNYPITKRNLKIERAMIIIHGAGRNADDYFSTGMAATFLNQGLENTLVISPRYAGNDDRACKDTLATNEIAWDCGDWKNGFEALNYKGVFSYDFLDELIKKSPTPTSSPI